MTVESAPAEDLRMDVAALFGALWARALRIVIVTVLLVVVTFVALMFVPKQYESVAQLLVEDRSNTYTQAATQGASGTTSGVSADALVSSQIELIKSRDTLLAVVDQLNLRSLSEFNGAGAVNPLTAILSLIGKKPEGKGTDETTRAVGRGARACLRGGSGPGGGGANTTRDRNAGCGVVARRTSRSRGAHIDACRPGLVRRVR